ncbi:MAG: iron-sulfur cluster assembly accessory protein [archaeon]
MDSCNTTGNAQVGGTQTAHHAHASIISLSEKAAEKVKEFMVKDGKHGYGLRVQVLPGGCSGYTYSLTFQKSGLDSDIKIESHGVVVYVDKMSEELIQGSTIDYAESLNGAGFTVNNPQVNSSCGCGKSWS